MGQRKAQGPFERVATPHGGLERGAAAAERKTRSGCIGEDGAYRFVFPGFLVACNYFS